MDNQKLVEFIPAILMLASVMTIVLVVLLKFGDRLFDRGFQSDNILIFVVSFLFVIILITHLFKEQPWTADTLKIVIGVLIGAGSAKLNKQKDKDAGDKKMEFNGNEIKDSIVNQALGDINQKIDNFKSEMSKIENAVINQYPTIEKKLDSMKKDSLRPQITKPEHLRLETEDLNLLTKLKHIQSTEDDWTWKWMEECIKYPDFNEKINQKMRDLENQGWKIVSLNFDNTGKGIHINFQLEKPFE